MADLPLQSPDRSDADGRALDILLVLGLAPFWLPVLGFALAATWATAGRPLLFSQLRMGRGRASFRIFKIRTMREGISAPEGALFEDWTYESDPRVTPVGAWLRRYRVDELPQLINVLRGEMSIVGPRPEPIEIAEHLGNEILHYHERHKVRPGLTGLCQISPLYTDFGTIEKSAHKLELDLEYVRERSLWLNAKIMLRTIRVILGGWGMS